MRVAAWALLLALFAGCAAKPPAPVVDRSADPARNSLTSDGRYRVRPGDSLYAIAFRFGLDYRDVARWNAIRPPYLIYPEQLLRLAPSTPPVAQRPVTPQPVSPAVPRSDAPEPRPSEAPTRPQPPPPTRAGTPAVGGDPERWLWPVQGRVLRGFSASDPARNGLDIAGAEGQPVIAAAGGAVVYSGNGLLGYGELIIIKHSERMLSAYAHNRVRLVAEGATVDAGQKIAELGRNDRNEQVLHFEIRINGRPVNPLNYLPRPGRK